MVDSDQWLEGMRKSGGFRAPLALITDHYSLTTKLVYRISGRNAVCGCPRMTVLHRTEVRQWTRGSRLLETRTATRYPGCPGITTLGSLR